MIIHLNQRQVINQGKESKNIIQQVDQSSKSSTTIEQIGNSTQQVAQQISRTLLSSDGQMNTIEINDQTQNIQVKRSQSKIQN